MFWPVVSKCTAALPEVKPRYLMGVGYPLDLVVCTALGVDMYDCVYPTRTARQVNALSAPLSCCGNHLIPWAHPGFELVAQVWYGACPKRLTQIEECSNGF